MGGKKALKGIAHELLGTFTSRNNDIDGYWAMGVLRLYAERNCIRNITLDLTGEASHVSNESPVSVVERTYEHWIRNALARLNVTTKLAVAQIKIDFLTYEEFPDAVRDTRGDPYLCTVLITGANGVAYSVSKLGVCASHDPNKDHRSVRNE